MQFKQWAVNLSVGAALAALSGSIAASGFALIEQSGSGLGNAYAGGAASAEDASTIFYNPAGMSRLNGKQVVIAGHLIKPTIKFSGTGLAGSTNTGGDAGSVELVPNAYFAMEVHPSIRIGMGVNVPFALQTEYDPSWVGRGQAIKSGITTLNLNPSAAYKFNDSLSIGAGINYQHINSELTWREGASGTAAVNTNDSAWGYNVGALYSFNKQTRIGFSYRSAIDYTMQGDVTYSASPAWNEPVTLAVKMPDSFSSSVFHSVDDEWDLMADLSWTNWSKYQQQEIIRSGGANILSAPRSWENTWRAAFGVNHHYSDKWTSRAGFAYDQSPVPDPLRSARIPDNDRFWLSLGGQYKPSSRGAIDFGYAHLFIMDSTIADMQGAGKGDLVGTYNNSADILSVQYTQSF